MKNTNYDLFVYRKKIGKEKGNSAPLQATCQTHVQDLNKTILSFEEKEKKVRWILFTLFKEYCFFL